MGDPTGFFTRFSRRRQRQQQTANEVVDLQRAVFGELPVPIMCLVPMPCLPENPLSIKRPFPSLFSLLFK